MTLSIEAYCALLARMGVQIEAAEHRALDHVGKLVEQTSKEMIGHDNDWPELAERTIEEKSRAGYGVPNPLLRTGNMRDSIKHHVDGHSSVAIGSNLPRAKWHEDGTPHVPPRPFLSTAMVKEQAHIEQIIGHEIVKVLSGQA